MENVFSEKAKVTKIEKISQFRQTVEKVPTLAPTETRKELAKVANVGHDTIAKAKANQAIQYKGEISLSQISVKVKPIDTQKELAKVAAVSHDTISPRRFVVLLMIFFLVSLHHKTVTK